MTQHKITGKTGYLGTLSIEDELDGKLVKLELRGPYANWIYKYLFNKLVRLYTMEEMK